MGTLGHRQVKKLVPDTPGEAGPVLGGQAQGPTLHTLCSGHRNFLGWQACLLSGRIERTREGGNDKCVDVDTLRAGDGEDARQAKGI